MKLTTALTGLFALSALARPLVEPFAIPTTAGASVSIPWSQFDANGGFIVPEGPNGLFIIKPSKDNKTEPVLTTVRIFGNTTTSLDGPAHTKRDSLPISSSGCTNKDLNWDDYLHAAFLFGYWCDKGTQIPSGVAWSAGVLWTRVGDAISFGCSWANSQRCAADELGEFNAYADKECGKPKTGWVQMKAWAKSYGRQLTSEGICGMEPGAAN